MVVLNPISFTYHINEMKRELILIIWKIRFRKDFPPLHYAKGKGKGAILLPFLQKYKLALPE